MLDKIVVGLDGSPRSELVLPWIRLLAPGRRLTLVRVVPPFLGVDVYSPALIAQTLQDAETYLARMSERMTPAPATVLRMGSPASALLDVAAESEADLIAITTHGGSPALRRTFGGTTEKLIHGACVPLLVVPAWCDVTPPHVNVRKILVPLDGSDESKMVLPLAGALAQRFDASLVLAHVAEVPPEASIRDLADYFHGLAPQLESKRVKAKGIVARGKPPAGLLRIAKRESVDLVVMSAHGYGAVGRMLFGSVASKLIRESLVPVIVAKYDALRRLKIEDEEMAIAPT